MAEADPRLPAEAAEAADVPTDPPVQISPASEVLQLVMSAPEQKILVIVLGKLVKYPSASDAEAEAQNLLLGQLVISAPTFSSMLLLL